MAVRGQVLLLPKLTLVDGEIIPSRDDVRVVD
jgi:hypothetical protein